MVTANLIIMWESVNWKMWQMVKEEGWGKEGEGSGGREGIEYGWASFTSHK